jgi:hypothetical protein
MENYFETLPEIAMEKILSYLQPAQKKKLMIVNLFLYKTIRKHYDQSLWICLKSAAYVSCAISVSCSQNLMFFSSLQLKLNYISMMSSIRVIPNVRLGGTMNVFEIGTVFDDLSVLFAEFGSNFKVLEIDNCKISMFNLKLLLNETPHLEKLVIHETFCDGTSSWRKDGPPRLALEKLKDFSISYCDSEIQNITLALTKAKITSFKIISNDLQVLVPMLLKHSEIKKLTIHSKNRASVTLPIIIREMKLDEISLDFDSCPENKGLMRQIILMQYHNLKTIDLSKTVLQDADFLALGACYYLENLKIILNSLSSHVFKRIILFQELKELTLIKNDKKASSQHLKIITATKNVNLTKLEIIYPFIIINDVDFGELDVNAPNIKHLVVQSRITGTLAMNVVNNLFGLETLKLVDSKPFYSTIIIDADSPVLNTNMRELSLNFDAKSHPSIVLSIINKFPELKKVEILTSEQGFDFNYLMSHIIGDLKNLRVLKINNLKSIVLNKKKLDLITILKELGPNLQHVSFNATQPFFSQSVYDIIGRQFSFVTHNGFRTEFYK